MFMAIKSVAKNAIHVTISLMKPLLLYQKQLEGKYWIRRDSMCTAKNVIYLAYCTKCGEQGTGSTVSWKPRLSNYKSHIKQSVHSCKIVKHFIEKCNDPIVPFKYLRFVILDVLTNTESLSKDDIEDLLLKKEKFWCGTSNPTSRLKWIA